MLLKRRAVKNLCPLRSTLNQPLKNVLRERLDLVLDHIQDVRSQNDLLGIGICFSCGHFLSSFCCAFRNQEARLVYGRGLTVDMKGVPWLCAGENGP
ncbi:hypothetical protein [Limnohabitans sp. G3-2]|uniref:hypothetical protein n=1 Tax=Limnohabitans sp. G3-2 TaxID=1100711 RepID=UPI00117995E7|nr:hypothetical protein [Limnohabitans sp. G3-2]